MKTVWLVALAACTPAHADGLARERISGTVVAAGPLYPSKTKARAAAPSKPDGVGWSLTVVRDHGDVIEARTAVKSGRDCVETWREPFELTVFVRRDSLLRRTARDVTKQGADGTLVVIDRGAPITSAGAWADPILGATGVAPPADAYMYSLAKYARAALPPPSGERLACSPPQTKSEWQEHQRREAEQREKEEQRKRPPKQHKNDTERMADVPPGDSLRIDTRALEPTWCAVSTATRWGEEKPPTKPTFDGTAIEVYGGRHDDVAFRAGKGFLADVQATCGRVRLRVDASALTDASGGSGVVLGSRRSLTYVPKPGPVTWADGTPAGRFDGHHVRYEVRDVEMIKGRYCVHVSSRLLGERLCHRKADVETHDDT
jgi:hypothetical protein